MALGETLAFLITADGAQAIGELGKVAAAARAAGEEAAGAGGGLGLIGGAALTAGVGAAGAAIAKFTEDSVKHYLDAADAVLKFQRVAGGTAEQASTMVSVFKALGIDTDAAATGIIRLGREAETGGAKLATVGVGIAKTNVGSVDLVGTLANVADAYQKAGSAAERDTILFDAFGRGGQALLPLLNQNSDALRRLFAEAAAHGEIFSQSQLNQAEDLKIRMRELGIEFKGVGDAIARFVLPFLERFTTGLERVLVAFHITSQSSLDAADAQAQFASDTANAADALQQQATAADQAATEVKTVRDALISVVDANKGVADAEAAVATARDAAAKRTDDIAKATQGYEDAVRSVASAENALAEAEATALEKPLRDTLALHAATFAVTDAVKAHAQAVEEYGANSEEAAKAADAITSAQLNQRDTQRKASQPDTSVDQAKANLANANDAVAAAQQAINTAEKEDPARALADAEDSLAAAVGRQADAQAAAKTAIDKSKQSTADLKSGMDAYIADLKAAGVDPATIAVFQNIENAAFAARTQLDLLTAAQDEMDRTVKNPGLVGPVAGRSTSSSDIGANFDPATGKPYPSVVGPVAGRQTTSSSVVINVPVQTNADPGQIAGAIAYAMTARGL